MKYILLYILMIFFSKFINDLSFASNFNLCNIAYNFGYCKNSKNTEETGVYLLNICVFIIKL